MQLILLHKMKYILLFSTAFILAFAACNGPENPIISSNNGYPPKDSIKIAQWDTLTQKIAIRWRPDSTVNTFHISATDTIQYMDIDGEPRRFSATFRTDSALTWVVFYQVNNELKLVRFREKRELPKPSVKEAFSYLDKGEIFYSTERSKDLMPGDLMASFRLLKAQENVRPPEQLEAEYARYWNITKKSVENYRAGLRKN